MKKILIEIDPAEAFDRLTILFIKIKNCLDLAIKKELEQQCEDLCERINNGIGYTLAKKIFQSQEFKNLQETNSNIFNLVKDNPDEEIQKANKLRSDAKRQLQNKFFGNSLEEIKICI